MAQRYHSEKTRCAQIIYIIRQLNGRELRRNTFHLKLSQTKPDHIDDETPDPYDVESLLFDCPHMQIEPHQAPAVMEEAPAPVQPVPAALGNPVPAHLNDVLAQRGRGGARGPRRGRGYHPVRITSRGRQVNAPPRYLP